MACELEKKRFTHAQKKELRANGINPYHREEAKAYFENKKREEEAAAAAAAEAEAEAARLYREANPPPEDLLKLILTELKSK